MAKPQDSTNLPSLYAELNRLGQRQEYEKAIKVANKSKLYYHVWFLRFKGKFILRIWQHMFILILMLFMIIIIIIIM